MKSLAPWLGRIVLCRPNLLAVLLFASIGFWVPARGQEASSVRVDVAIELDRLTLQTGEPLAGRFVVSAHGIAGQSKAFPLKLYLVTGRAIAEVEQGIQTSTGKVVTGKATPRDVFDSLPYDLVQIAIDRELRTLYNFPRAVQRVYETEVTRDGRFVVPIDQGGPVYPKDFGAPSTLQGSIFMYVIAELETDEFGGSRAWDDALVNVVPLLPRFANLVASVDPSTPPRALQPFVVVLKYDMTGLPSDPAKSVSVRQAASVKERKPLKDRPYQTSHARHVPIPGSSDGKGSFEKRWRVTVPRAGTYDFDFELTCPGYLLGAKKLSVQVGAQPAPQPPAPAPTKAFPDWILDKTTLDPDKLEGKALIHGSISGVSLTGFTANHDRAFVESGGYAPNCSMKVVASGTPPQRLRNGDKFQMTLNATATKQGADPPDGRQPGFQVAGNIWASKHLRVTATPHSSGISFPEREDGTAVSAGGYFNKWWGSDSRVYTLEVVAADWTGPLEVGVYFPGFGTFARYTYRQEKAAKPTGSTSAAKPTPKIEPDEDFPPLTVVLEPSDIEVSPRSGMGTPVTLKIKGDRPNWKPVEVLIDTVDAWGALRINRYLKVEGKGSRATGDMWKTNDGFFHWNLTALANLGIGGGTYVVPITVRQVGHGEVRRFLTVRVPMTPRRPLPTIGRTPARAEDLAGRFEVERLDLTIGGIPARNRLLVRGAEVGDEPLVLRFPELDRGRLPGGVLVVPGDSMVHVADADKVVSQGVPHIVFDLTFLASDDAAPGSATVRVVIQQGNREVSVVFSVTLRR